MLGFEPVTRSRMKGDFGVGRIAMLTGFNQLFGLMQRSRIHQNDVLFLRSWIEEVARHGSILAAALANGRPIGSVEIGFGAAQFSSRGYAPTI
jgi:hypothetical protein